MSWGLGGFSFCFVHMIRPAALTEDSLAEAVAFLVRADRRLARIHAEFGAPPMWARKPGFATLVQIVLEQQVSLASARAAFSRLRAAVPAMQPEEFLRLGDAELRRIGFSRQKADYCRGLADAIVTGELGLKRIT